MIYKPIGLNPSCQVFKVKRVSQKGIYSFFILSVYPSQIFPACRLFAKIAHRAIFSRSALLKGRCKILTFKYIVIEKVPL
jgi:hypothetical protein